MTGILVALDPAFFAVPSIVSNEDELGDLIDRLIEWDNFATSQREVTACILEATSQFLEDAGAYPIHSDVECMLRMFGLEFVYTAADIAKILLRLLERSPTFEDLSEIEVADTQDFECDPALVNYTVEAIRSGCAKLVSTAAFACQVQQSARHSVRVAFADRFDGRERMQVQVYVAGVHGDPRCNFEGRVSTTILLTSSVAEVLESFDPAAIWCLDGDERAVSLAIRLRSKTIAGLSSIYDRGLRPFSVGPHFIPSLRANGGGHSGQFAGATLDECAKLVAKDVRSRPQPFLTRVSAGRKMVQQTRADGARAWRVHISERGVGLRLMYWEHTNGALEFANIGPKRELTIL